MIFKVQADSLPLSEDLTGALRVGNSRVLLELVIHAFQDGIAPETIVEMYSAITLADVYAVVAYYLRHPMEVEAYLARRKAAGDELERTNEPYQGDLRELRSRHLKERES